MLLTVGRGIVGQWSCLRTSQLYERVGGRVPRLRVTFDPSTCFRGRDMRSKVRLCQLMRQTTDVGLCGREEGDEHVEWAWLCGGCVAPPIQEMRLVVVWATVALKNVCAVWPCGCCVFIVVGFRWTSGVQSTPHRELVSLRHRVVHCGCGLALPFRYSFRPIVLL